MRIIDEFEELLTSPLLMLAEIEATGRASGDCDDLAMLSASILASIGADVRFIAVGELEDGGFSHVFTQYRFPEWPDWIDFDVTIPAPRERSGRFLIEEVKS